MRLILFGGATVLFAGDWRQVNPVVLFGTPADVPYRFAFLERRPAIPFNRSFFARSAEKKDAAIADFLVWKKAV